MTIDKKFFKQQDLDPDFKTAAMCTEGGVFNCVAVKRGMTVQIKDTKNLNGAVLDFDHDEWRAFINGVKTGEFDV